MAKAQINQYDKILKENLEAALPGLIKNVLGIRAVYTEELPDAIQHTKERKPDVLKKIRDKGNKTFVLHIEFQVKDEREMVFRMAEYYIMLLRKYRLPVKQYVLYLGKSNPTMPAHLHAEQLSFQYTLLSLAQIDYRLFLQSKKPEEKIMAILADFGKQPADLAVAEIVKQVIHSSIGDFKQQRHLRQLSILAQLRNLAGANFNIMDSIAEFIKKENDVLYRLGAKEEQEKIAANLLTKMNLSEAQVADITNLPLETVKKIKKDLKKKA